MELGLAGRRAVVTGGSKGIGKAIAAELVTEGAAVAICSRHPGELEATAAELTKLAADAATSTVLAMPCDVTDPGQVTAFADAAAAALGGLDILVNNAGGARPGQFATLTDEEWHTDIETKLFSQIRCTRAALPYLRQSSAPRCAQRFSKAWKLPCPSRVTTTGISPRLEVRHVLGFISSASRHRKLQLAPLKMHSCSRA